MAHILARRRPSSQSMIKTVAIVGGTHGNERAGVHLVKLFDKNPNLVSRPSFKTTWLLSNVEAVKADRRYLFRDLNRCFDKEYLDLAEKSEDKHVEMKRCLELNEILGPKFGDGPKTDLVLDLHNTTANSGVLLCFHKNDKFACEVAAYMKRFVPEIVTVFWPQDDPPFLPTIGRSGMTIEVGPVPHSTVNSEIFEKTKTLLQTALDFVELHNRLVQNPKDSSVSEIVVRMQVAERVAEIDYPRDDDGDLCAFIHPSLQGIPELKEGKTIKHGSPVFLSTLGETITLDLVSLQKLHPKIDPKKEYHCMFVNEAAYYEKGVAFMLTELKEYEVRTLTSNSSSKL